MKTLLINPPQTTYDGSLPFEKAIPLGLLYIGTILKRNNYQVKILDTLVDDENINKIDKNQHGMSWKKIDEKICLFKPDIIGISGLSTAQIPNVKYLLKRIKLIDEDIFTMVGGAHVSAKPIEFIDSCTECDLVIIGEGEKKIINILKYLEGEKDLNIIDGLCYKYKDKVKITENKFIETIDEIPFPDYDLIELEKYFTNSFYGKKIRKIPMITSRGCPFNCVFCSIHLHMGRKWRANSPSYVINHIINVIEKHNINFISFEDDNMTLDKTRFNSILDMIIENDLHIKWDTPNGIRADTLSKDILIKMKKSGCNKITIAIESGNQYILNNIIKKDLNLNDVINTAKLCNEVNIPLSAFYVIGFPGETLENMRETINFAINLNNKYNVAMYLMVATPLLETELYKICKEKNYLVKDIAPRDLSEGTQIHGRGLIITEDFTPEEVKKVALEGRKKFRRNSFNKYYNQPIFLFKNLVNGRLNFQSIYQYFNLLFGINSDPKTVPHQQLQKEQLYPNLNMPEEAPVYAPLEDEFAQTQS